jgi:acyl-CoA thioesterase FadM
MRSACHAEFGHDTGMFSVHQLHPEIALRLAGSATAGLARLGTGLQRLITELETGLVIVSNQVTYVGPLTFFSARQISSTAAVSLRADGRLVIFDIRHLVNGEDAVAVRVVARPVRLSGGPALDAAPYTVDERVRALFDLDEIVPSETVPSRSLRGLISTVTAGATELGGGEVPVFIGRSDCEFADQWLHARLPSLVATARERLLLDGAGDLAACVQEPITEYHGEFFRPMYFGDHGRITTTAYRKGATVYAVHRVHGALPPGAAEEQRPLSALALETF